DLPAAGVELPAGDLDVLALERGDDVGGDDALLGEAARVEPDADVALEVALEGDLPDPGHRLELLLDLIARDVGQELPGERAVHADGQDGRVVGVRLGDGDGGDVVGEPTLGLGHAGLDVLEGEVDVAGDVEADGD